MMSLVVYVSIPLQMISLAYSQIYVDICFSIKSAPRGTKLFSSPLLENIIFTELYY